MNPNKLDTHRCAPGHGFHEMTAIGKTNNNIQEMKKKKVGLNGWLATTQLTVSGMAGKFV